MENFRQKNESSTADLISSLVTDLPQPSEARKWRSSYFIGWLAVFALLAVATYTVAYFWPSMAHLPTNTFDSHFVMISSLWMVAFLFCARVSFLKSIPLSDTKAVRYFFAAVVALLGVAIFGGESPLQVVQEFPGEMALWRAPCGFFILLTGLGAGSLFVLAARRAAPTRASNFGAWMLASAGCLSSFCMTMICRHENPGHVLIWHIVPVFALAILGMKLGEAILITKKIDRM
jgi:hypothetical protein